MLLNCCTQYAGKFGKLSSGYRTGKGQFSFQYKRKALPKNVPTTRQLHSFCMLVRLGSKFFNPDFNSTWTKNYQMFRLDLERAEEPEIELPTSIHHRKSKDLKKKKKKPSASLTMWKPLLWITKNLGKFFFFFFFFFNKLRKILKELEYQTTLPVSWETCIQDKKWQLEPDLEQLTGSKLGKSISRLYIVTLLI